MRVSIAESKIRKIRLAVLLVILILAWSSGCNLPQRILTPTPLITSTNISTPVGITPSLRPSPDSLLTPTYPQIDPNPSQQTTPTTHPSTSTPDLPYVTPAQYHIVAVLDYDEQSLSIVDTINYTNQNSTVLTSLLLVVEPNLVPGGFELNSIAWGDGGGVEGYDLSGNQLLIPLPQPLPPGVELRIVMDYSLQLPLLADHSIYGKPEAYGYSAKQTNLVDWYPYIPPYDNDRGWLVHPVWALGEYQVYGVADFDVDFSLTRPVEDLVIAAPTLAIQDGDHYIYHLEAARSFALSLSTDYVVQTGEVDGVTILSYSFPYDEAAAQEALNNTADALRLFSRLISAYPRTSLSIVEADFLDGMEYDGLFFLSYGFYNLYDGTPKGYLTFIAAHETAHQWWYGLVGNDQALEPWLDESLCTYMELIFYKNNYLDYSPPAGGSLANWWWYYRVYFYKPTGWVDSSIYDFYDPLAYRNAVYLRGAIFLDELRNLIGDQAFFGFISDYTKTNAHSIATTKDFFASLRKFTSADLYEIITSYFQTMR